jgi:hypothetical protein
MARIVFSHYRCKRPPRMKKTKAAAIACGPIVAKTATAEPERTKRLQPKHRPGKDVPAHPFPITQIVVTKGTKELKAMRADRMPARPRKPDPEVEEFFARNVRPGGPQAPPRKP